MLLHRFLFLLLCTSITSALHAHPGGLDEHGGHVDKKTGQYHYHRTADGRALTDGEKEYAEAQRRFGLVIEQRESARLRKEAQREAQREEKRQAKQTARDNKELIKLPPRYLFHHVKQNPYHVVHFEDSGEFWKATNEYSQPVNFKKSEIVLIEALLSKEDYRTWRDASGKYAVIASFVKLDGTKLTLELIDGREATLDIAKLSEVDRYFAEKEFTPRKMP